MNSSLKLNFIALWCGNLRNQLLIFFIGFYNLSHAVSMHSDPIQTGVFPSKTAFKAYQIPNIITFAPSVMCAAGGQTVTISGSNFISANAVTFNGINAASFTVINSTTIKAVTPASLTSGTIAVKNADGVAVSSTLYTVSSPQITAASNLNNVCRGSHLNLSSSGTEINTLSSVPEGFEYRIPTNWVRLSTMPSSWDFGEVPYSGVYNLRQLYSTHSPLNTWIISDARILDAGTTYTISFWEFIKPNGSSTYVGEKLKLTVGTSQTIADQNIVLLDLGLHRADNYTFRTATFTPTTSGTYYFGLNAYSDANQGVIHIDEFLIPGVVDGKYSWTATSEGYTSTVVNTLVAINSTTDYIVSATNGHGCVATDTVTVVVRTANPSIVQSEVGMTINTGDFLWNGYRDNDWETRDNWYKYNGTAFMTIAYNTPLPSPSNNVFILPSSTPEACISATNNVRISTNLSNTAKNLFIGTGATLISSGRLQIEGNWINNGTYSQLGLPIQASVRLTGSSNQTIGGSSTDHFNNLWLNKTDGIVTLNKPISVTTLTMLNGIIKTSTTNLLTIGSGTTSATVGTINWTAGTIVGPLKRFYAMTASNTISSGIFPVGNLNYNRYARVNFTANPGGGTITAEYKSGVCPIGYNGLAAIINDQLISNYENEGYWEITPDGGNLNTTNYDLVLRGNRLSTVNNPAKLRIIKSSNHLAWNDNPSGDGNHVAAVAAATTTPATPVSTDFIIGANAMRGFSWFNIGSDNSNPLPVELTQFSADCSTKGVMLEWSTASEENSHQFILEKSLDMVDWDAIAHIQAAGNSNYNTDYKRMDTHHSNGVIYYRLVQVDKNGEEKFYEPISVSCENDVNNLHVFPNPSKGDFNVKIESTANISHATLQLTDMTGRIISSRSVNITKGTNQLIFENNYLNPGIYCLFLLTDNNLFKPVHIVLE